MGFADVLMGKPIPTAESGDEKIGSLGAIPVLGLDALSSAAYGPEALLTVLLPLGAAGPRVMVVLAPIIVLVLLLVSVSYRQTIPAYPNGGGSYTVARENLGARASLLAAAALALDFILNVAVGIAAGAGALVSAFPALLPYTLPLCLGVLVVMTLVNLRGVHSTTVAFAIPTYAFVTCLFAILAIGFVRFVGGDTAPLVAPPTPHGFMRTATTLLVLRAFANGCTALTGVEAISNGVPVFRDPPVKHARRALATITTILAILLLGETLLCNVFGVVATEPGRPGFQSVLSSLASAVVGRGVLYHVMIASVVAVLLLSANTSFAGFPRLCRVLAVDGYLPEPFVHRGRRLAFGYGVIALAVISGLLLVAFEGITDRLIPLFAIGAFAAFTLSQAGMVIHWRRTGGPHARRAIAINAVGAIATGTTLVIVLVAKFTEGAWLSVVIVAAIILLMRRIRRHFDEVAAVTDVHVALELGPIDPPIVVVPLRRWDALAVKAMLIALQQGREIIAVQVRTDDRDVEDLGARWTELVARPVARRGLPVPRIEILRSDYRDVYGPLLERVHELADAHPRSQIIVVIPELVEPRWYHALLHGHTATLLRYTLLRHGGPQVVVATTPWHVGEARSERRLLRVKVGAP